jgi:cobalt-zinc-cadmium efflux system protein
VSRSVRLGVVLALNLVLVGVLLILGLTARSLGVLAEGADYLADAAAMALSLLAVWLSKRPPTQARPGGYPRATAFSGVVNGGWLLVVSVLVVAGSLDRLATRTPHVRGLPVLVVSAVAAAVMVIGALILGGDADDPDDEGGELNMQAVLLDTAADAATAAGVAVTGAVILTTGRLYSLDPTVALIISVIAAYHAIRLLQRVASTLRARPPGLKSATGRAGRV